MGGKQVKYSNDGRFLILIKFSWSRNYFDQIYINVKKTIAWVLMTSRPEKEEYDLNTTDDGEPVIEDWCQSWRA